MGTRYQNSTARLKACREQLIALIETSRKLGFSNSIEFRTIEKALEAIEEKIRAVSKERRTRRTIGDLAHEEAYINEGL